MEPKKLLLGLDLGTNSVGFCLTDENSHIVKKNGKYLWGVRLFEQAQSKESRRKFRSSRRLTQRRVARIAMLQNFFEDEINKLDNNFLLRINTSQLVEEDRNWQTGSLLFGENAKDISIHKNGKDIVLKHESDFYKYFPTIYHLRMYLMKSNSREDIRLVYLAISHMLKHRGNFLNENPDFNIKDGNDAKEHLQNALAILKEIIIREQELDLDEDMSSPIIGDSEFNELIKYYNGEFKLEDNPDNSDVESKGQKKKINLSVKKEKVTDFIMNKLDFPSQLPKKNKVKDVFVKLIFGEEVDVKVLLSLDKNPDEVKKISFDSETFSDDLKTLYDQYGDTDNGKNLDVVAELEKTYGYLKSNQIMLGKTTISEAMVEKYRLHNEELKLLKKLIKKYLTKEDYSNFFRKDNNCDSKDNNKTKSATYASYIGYSKSNNIKIKHFSSLANKGPGEKQNLLYEEIKKLFPSILNKISEQFNYIIKADSKKKIDEAIDELMVAVTDDAETVANLNFMSDIMIKMENKSYLRLIKSSLNRYIPYQLHLADLKAILDKQSVYYPFLQNKDESNLTVAQKITEIFKFKIPYYVGPLKITDNKDHNYSWIIRKNVKKIYPWNFSEVVDLDKTEEEFIKRMQGRCSQLRDKLSMPIRTLLYQEFNVRQELNKLYINDLPIAEDDKNYLIEEIYKKGGEISISNFKKCLMQKNNINTIKIGTMKKEEDKISDFLKSSLSTYVQLHSAFKNALDDDNVAKLIDEAITVRTIISEDDRFKKYLRSNKNKFNFSNEQIDALSRIKKDKFGNLSSYLLTELRGCDTDGVTNENSQSIMDVIRTTNLNLNEIIFDSKYGFQNAIYYHNKKFTNDEANIEDYVDKLYISPSMKRPLIQAYKIAEELEKIVGRKIDEYYIEATRGPDKEKKGKATKSRKDQISDFYNSAEEFIKEVNERRESEKQINILDQLKNEEKTKFNRKKVQLYFLQCGIDLYTNEIININKLGDYDIDHIYPRAKIKDDSLDNLVLTKKDNNSRKSDRFPIPYNDFLNLQWENDKQRINFFKKLKDSKLISAEKYSRLTRRSELQDDELFDFVDSQLVNTSQAVKGLANAIKERKITENGKVPEVVFVKSKIISDYRKNHDLLKSRDANDYHHAHDALLNVCIGRALNEYYTKPIALKRVKGMEWEQLKKDFGKTTNVDKFLDNYTDGVKLPIKDGDYIVWDYKDDKSQKYLDKQIKENFNILFTHRPYLYNDILGKTSLTSASNIKKQNKYLPTKSTSNSTIVNNTSLKQKALSILKDKMKDCAKYGGYADQRCAAYSLIKATNKKNKNEIYIFPINGITHKKYLASGDKNVLLNEINSSGLQNTTILIPEFKVNTVLSWDDKSKCIITGKTNDSYFLKNIKQPHYPYEQICTIKKISKICKKFISAQFGKTILKGTINNFDSKQRIEFDAFLKELEYQTNDDKLLVSVRTLYDEDNKQIEEKEYLKRTEIESLIEYISQILKRLDICGYVSSQYAKLNNFINLIEENKLKIYELCFLIREIVSYLHNSRTSMNMKMLKENNKSCSENAGAQTIGTKVTDKPFRIIYESITGYYSKQIWPFEEEN